MLRLAQHDPRRLTLSPGPNQLRRAEEEPRFAFGILIAIRGVNSVSLLRFRVQFSHRAFGGFLGIGCADGRAERGDGVSLLEHHRHRRTRCHERDEGRIERALAVDGVKLLRLRLTEVHDARGAYVESLLLEMRDDFSGLAAAKRVGLDDREREIAGHGELDQGAMSFRTMSPRVRKPTRRPPRTTGTRSTSLFVMSAATFANDCSGATHNT